MTDRSTRRAYLASVGALACLAGCSTGGTGAGDAARQDRSDTPRATGETDSATGTARSTGESPNAPTSGSSGASDPAFVRWAPGILADSGASLTHLTVSDFLDAESSFEPGNAERIAANTGLAFAEAAGVDRADVREVFGIAAEGAVCEGSFGADDVSVASLADDGRNPTRGDDYRGYEVWTADLLSVAVRDGTLVVTDDPRETVEALIDASEDPDSRLGARTDYPGPIEAGDPPSMGVIDLSGDAAFAPDSVEIRTRRWEFGDAETALTETLRFADEASVDRERVESGLADLSEYDQYRDLAVERDGRDVRVSGVVPNGVFSVFGTEVATPTPTTARPSSRLQVTNAYGDVEDEAISVVHLTATKAPGSEDVDLEGVRIRFPGSDGSQSVRHAESVDPSTNAVFETTPIKDGNESLPVVDDPADRVELTIPLEQSGAPDLGPLEAGSSVEVSLTTGPGGTTAEELVVPDTLAGENVVAL